MAKVIVAIPERDFDPTEVAIPWRELTRRGHTVVFATPLGNPGMADPIMLTGQGLDVWGLVPYLRAAPLVGLFLRANRAAREAYFQMAGDPRFREPMRWETAQASAFDGLVLPGGHRARGMRAYLESPHVQRLAIDFFRADKPVGAICHGVLVLARSIDPLTGVSVLHGRKTTALTWRTERAAARLAGVTRFWDPHYYRTYQEAPGQPAGFMSVEREVIRSLASPDDFLDASPDEPYYRRRTSGLDRDSDEDLTPAFAVRDGPYISARWPGDAHLFAKAFAEVLEGR
jgi:putative intracellular protease/amidase